MGNNKSKNLNKEQLNNQLQFKTEEDNNIIIDLEIYNYNKKMKYVFCVIKINYLKIIKMNIFL